MRRVSVGRALLGVGALAVAAVAVGFAPETEDIVRPFPVRGVQGERVEARTLGAEVEGIGAAEEVTVEYGFAPPALPTEGFWLVVEATVTTWKERQSLTYASVRAGDATYRTFSSLPAPALVGYSFDPGVPVTGQLLFELPDEALDTAVAEGIEVSFAAGIDPRLDTVAVVEVEGSDVELRPTIAIERAVVEGRG